MCPQIRLDLMSHLARDQLTLDIIEQECTAVAVIVTFGHFHFTTFNCTRVAMITAAVEPYQSHLCFDDSCRNSGGASRTKYLWSECTPSLGLAAQPHAKNGWL